MTYCIEKSAFVMSWISSSWRLVSFYGGGGYWKRQHQIIYKLKSDIIKTQTHGSYRGQYTRNFKGLFHVKRSLHVVQACIDFSPEFGVNSCKRSERKSLCFSSFLYQLYQIYIVNLSRKTAFAISKTFFLSDLSGTLFSKFWLFFYSKHEQEGKYILLRYHPFTELVFYAASIVLQSATCDEEIIVL